MFGMLDYRAHKLYWLLSRPIWAFNWLLFFFSIFASFGIGEYFFKNFLAVFIVAAVSSVTIIGIPVTLLSKAVIWAFEKVFRFFIDVEPTSGRNAEQAWLVVTRGDVAILLLKLDQKILDWTESDTDAFIRNLPSINKWFFAERIRARFSAIMDEMKRRHSNGEEIAGLDLYTADQINKKNGLTMNWKEKVFGNEHFIALAFQFIALFALSVYATS